MHPLSRRGMLFGVSSSILLPSFVRSSTAAGDASTASGIPTSDLVSVREFGARGDGVSDDTAGINRAITSAPSGGTIFFPDGLYLISNDHLFGGLSMAALPVGVHVLMSENAWVKRHPRELRGIQAFFTCSGKNILQVNVDGDEYRGSMTGQWAKAESYGVHCQRRQRADWVHVVSSKFRNLTFGIITEDNTNWQVFRCSFTRIRNSGILMGATPGGLCAHNRIEECSFLDMGDTAAAFYQNGGSSGEIAYNLIRKCVARNTQYRTNGYAFDVEAGHRPGTQHHNTFSENTVVQSVRSVHSQGGLTMGDFCEHSSITNNIARGNLNTHADFGVNIPKSRDIVVEGNSIKGFRGRAVNADGALMPTIRRNCIENCGGAGSAVYSAIVLSDAFGSRSASVAENELSWSSDYPYGGEASAAIYCARPYGTEVRDLVIERNTIRNPIDIGIYLFGHPGQSIQGARIEGNVITGDGSPGLFTRWPIYASYIDGLVLADNQITGARRGIDLSGSRVVEQRNNVMTSKHL